MALTVAAVSQKWETNPETVTTLSINLSIPRIAFQVPITGSSGLFFTGAQDG